MFMIDTKNNKLDVYIVSATVLPLQPTAIILRNVGKMGNLNTFQSMIKPGANVDVVVLDNPGWSEDSELDYHNRKRYVQTLYTESKQPVYIVGLQGFKWAGSLRVIKPMKAHLLGKVSVQKIVEMRQANKQMANTAIDNVKMLNTFSILNVLGNIVEAWTLKSDSDVSFLDIPAEARQDIFMPGYISSVIQANSKYPLDIIRYVINHVLDEWYIGQTRFEQTIRVLMSQGLTDIIVNTMSVSAIINGEEYLFTDIDVNKDNVGLIERHIIIPFNNVKIDAMSEDIAF